METEIKAFAEACKPIQEADSLDVRAKAYEHLQFPPGWKGQSVYEFRKNQQADDLSSGKVRERNFDTFLEAMDEQERFAHPYGVIFIGNPGKGDTSLLHNTTLPWNDQTLTLILHNAEEVGTIVFNEPLQRVWKTPGFLTNTYVEKSPEGILLGDLEDMDGWYQSHALERERERVRFTRDQKELAVTLKLITRQRHACISSAQFPLARLGEGEVDSFLAHLMENV